MTNKKAIKVMGNNHGGNATIFQELKEIKSDVKELKKFLIINSLHRLVKNYDKQEKNKKER
jgi:hypothetical protein